jgi:M6 family metalloprotease-like protein
MRRIQPRVLLAVCAILSIVLSEGAAQETGAAGARLRDLNGRLLETLARAEPPAAPGAAAARAEAAAIIEARARTLEALAAANPAAVLQLAFSSDLIARLSAAFPASASRLEANGSWSGPIEYVIEDGLDFAAHRNIRTMDAGTETLSLQFAGAEPPGLKNGDIVRATGVRIGSVLAVSDATIVAPAADGPLTCSPAGPQNSIVLMVTMPGAPAPATITANDVHDTFFSESQPSLSAYWRENSYGQTWAQGDVRGWYTLDRVYSCDESAAIRAAAIAAADGDVDFTQYTRVFVIVNGMSGTCTWGGLGTLACGSLSSGDGTFTASTSWMRPGFFNPDDLLRDGVQIAAHEGGHNLGLRHANSRDYGSTPLGSPGDAGVVTEYGDMFSSMGRLRNNTYPEPWIGFGHYAAPHKRQLGWLTPEQAPAITASGSFLVEPAEQAGASIQALRIVRATQKVRGQMTTHSLWVEYRQPVGPFDSTLYPQVFTGALVHYEDSTNAGASHLLDFTPNSSIPEPTAQPDVADWSNPALVGTWTDPHTGLSITTSGATPAGLLVDVAFGPVMCVRANPTVSISPDNPTALAGSAVGYTVSVTNNDSQPCSNRTFTLSSALPGGWQTAFSSSSVTLAPSASTSVSMTKSVPPGTAEGTYAVDAAATSTDGAHSGYDTASCTVAPALPPLTTALAPLGSFTKNSTVPIAATVRRTDSTPVPGASVLFTVTSPTGSQATRTVLTDGAGRAAWSYKVLPKDPAGIYLVTAQTTLNGETAPAVQEDFTVVP